jgi:hypothetical protein
MLRITFHNPTSPGLIPLWRPGIASDLPRLVGISSLVFLNHLWAFNVPERRDAGVCSFAHTQVRKRTRLTPMELGFRWVLTPRLQLFRALDFGSEDTGRTTTLVPARNDLPCEGDFDGNIRTES